MFKLDSLAQRLWGSKSNVRFLILTSFVLVFAFLGARDIWTQEHRWADIVSGMFYRHDFLHPYLGEVRYYDKPLLSYWLIAALAKLTGILNATIVRIPSAAAGILSIWSIYKIGYYAKNKTLGMIAGWLLLTTFYFLFWARVSSADMLNVAGSLFAIAWYLEHRSEQSLYVYSVFFLAISLTCLCKGLVAAIVVLMVVGVDLIIQNSLLKHLNWKFCCGFLLGLIIYLIPFVLSGIFDNGEYGSNGLYLVYKENILRYFKPFDHQDPIYTYLLYLPIYTLPWSVLLMPALFSLIKRWPVMTKESKWIVWSLTALFLFFSLSGSRRSYYVLPMVPWAILLIADWLLETRLHLKWLALSVLSMFVILFLMVDLMPSLYYSKYGMNVFAEQLKQQAQPWGNWNIVLLDAEPKINFYLNLAPQTKNYSVIGKDRDLTAKTDLAQIWPILLNKPQNTIFISRNLYLAGLLPYFNGYHLVTLPDVPHWEILNNYHNILPIAFIPNEST